MVVGWHAEAHVPVCSVIEEMEMGEESVPGWTEANAAHGGRVRGLALTRASREEIP
jgi:hypothetical protein